MTKEEALRCLGTSLHSCNHDEKSEIGYGKRLYPICKCCFVTMVAAMRVIGASQPNHRALPAYAYTTYKGCGGYQPEIFHALDQTSLWVGPWCATKQEAYDAVRTYLRDMRQARARKVAR